MLQLKVAGRKLPFSRGILEMDLSSMQKVKPMGQRSRARHTDGCGIAQAEFKAWCPQLNATLEQTGPGPYFSLLFSQQSEASVSAGLEHRRLKSQERSCTQDSDTSLLAKDDALCPHSGIGWLLDDLVPCYPYTWRSTLQNRELTVHFPPYTQTSKNSACVLQVIAVF